MSGRITEFANKLSVKDSVNRKVTGHQQIRTNDLWWQFLQSIIRSSKEAYICAVLKTLEGQKLHTAGCPKYHNGACLKICSQHYVAHRKKTMSPARCLRPCLSQYRCSPRWHAQVSCAAKLWVYLSLELVRLCLSATEIGLMTNTKDAETISPCLQVLLSVRPPCCRIDSPSTE